MRFIYDSKYDVGDTVYMLMGWVTSVRVVERKIESVVGASENGVRYLLVGHERSVLFKAPVLEKALYSTKEQAVAVGEEKLRLYKQKRKEELERQIKTAEFDLEEKIGEMREQLAEDVKYLKKLIKEL